MKSSSRTVIDHPADRIDLAQWLSTMSDRDYQACSRSHRAAGTFREGGTFGMVNVESIGGHLLVQHYLAKKAEPNHVLMHSTNTRVYIPKATKALRAAFIKRGEIEDRILEVDPQGLHGVAVKLALWQQFDGARDGDGDDFVNTSYETLVKFTGVDYAAQATRW